MATAYQKRLKEVAGFAYVPDPNRGISADNPVHTKRRERKPSAFLRYHEK